MGGEGKGACDSAVHGSNELRDGKGIVVSVDDAVTFCGVGTIALLMRQAVANGVGQIRNRRRLENRLHG